MHTHRTETEFDTYPDAGILRDGWQAHCEDCEWASPVYAAHEAATMSADLHTRDASTLDNVARFKTLIAN